MVKFKRISALLLSLGVLFQATPMVFAKTEAEKKQEILAKIRKEAFENSQIMKTLHNLTDVYGPRLTGSPQLVEAGKWAMKQMDEWGFDKTYMDPWDFGHPGWTNERATGAIISPVKDNLVFEVLAWTPSTKGIVRGKAVKINFPRRPPTQAEFDKWKASMADKVRGNMVLIGNPRRIPVSFRPLNKRLSDESIKRRFNPPARSGAVTRAVRAGRGSGSGDGVKRLSFREVMRQLNQMLIDNSAAVQINDSRMTHGMIRAFGNRSFDVKKAVPTVVMRNEDYGRISRLVDAGKEVKLEFYIRNQTYPQGKTQYNTIGEITGYGKTKDEVIMLGGHLDAWHSATGATDNGIGCAVMMEAARILKAIGVKPKRTIRVALWSGEEQGLLGSRAYVAKHFGSFENPKPAYKKFGGYFNVDSGTGRVRGMSVFGPKEAATILDGATNSFRDLKFEGVNNTRSRRLGGSDHTSFNQAGLPGIGTLQDPIEYFSHTWHTNLDTYERIIPADVKASAAVVAAAVYELAMRDKLLPRLKKSEMPVSRIRR